MKIVSTDYQKSMNRAFRSFSTVVIKLQRANGEMTFAGEQILGVSRIAEVDPISRRLPTEVISFSLIDPNGIFDTNSPNAEFDEEDLGKNVSVSFGYYVNGKYEYIEPDIYILNQKPTYANGVASFKAQKRLYTLTKIYYKGIVTYSSFSYWALAFRVLTDAGLSQDDFILDDILKLYNTSAPLPIDTHKNCLQMIAHACGCALYTDSKNRIVIKKVNFTNPNVLDFTISRRDVVKDSETMKKIAPLHKIESYCYGYYDISDDETTIFSENIKSAEGGSYHIEFPVATNVAVYVNGNIINADIYAQAADFEIPSGDVEIVAKGNRVNKSASVYAKYVTSDTRNGEDSIKNPTISDYSVAAVIAENTALYLMRRNSATFSYRGNPEIEPMDAIYYSSPYGDTEKAIVLRNELEYNGSISGKMTIKLLRESGGGRLLDVLGEVVIDSKEEEITTTEIKDTKSDYTTNEMNKFIESVVI